ncbi:MAG: hypothetical protein V1904_01370 [Bacteroidota bacterium]
MQHFLLIIYINIFLLFSQHLFSQTDVNTGNNKTAKDKFTLGNYKGALEEYLLLIKNDSNNLLYNFRIGICYLNTNIDKSKAIPYLLKTTFDPKVELLVWYELGRAYMINYQFDEAIAKFKKYKEVTGGKESFYISSDRMIEMCEEAKSKIKNPINITVGNLGSEVNTEYPEYNPYVPADENYLVFTSKREGNTGNLMDFDGFITSDVYITYQKYDKWIKAKNIGATINSELVEETAGISADGTKLFVYCDNYTAMNEVLVSDKKGKTFMKPVFLGDNINSGKLETSATMTPDKKYLVFASNRNEQAGGMDLFISKKLPSGEWGPAENIGEPVNTIYDEDFPYFSADGKTLYFCSEGHNSMGGYDIFRTIWNEKDNTWNVPENLGYPLNTPDDDKTISLSLTGRHGYISSCRAEGYGDLDIYKVIFNDIDPAYAIISGTLMNKDSVSIYNIITPSDTVKNDSMTVIKNEITKDPIDSLIIPEKKVPKYISVDIAVTDKSSQKIFGRYIPNKENGKFLIILPPGVYEIFIYAEGFEKYSENITVFDRSSNTEIVKDIVLSASSIEKTN